MTAHELRKKYLDFFESKGHTIVPSARLVPENDPTTLFTGSGMQPMVPYLLGESHPSGARVADSQKAFRSGDIDDVGDNRHTTFFEMLGNWSFGDYFKAEQISWMWEFLTGELGLDPNRLYFTCFRGSEERGVPKDTESAELWQKLYADRGTDVRIGEDPERDGMGEGEHIFYYGEEKNWWSRVGIPSNMPAGEPGGPDSEIFWDFDPDGKLGLHERSEWKAEPCHVNCDCGRFMEIGNNVFMEYIRTEDGFEKLPKPNVDFGGGLERLTAAVLDTPDIFRISLFDEARAALEKRSGKRYGDDERETYAFRVILDHIRASVFLIGDGVLPSNKDQGYFVRRLIRRAVRYGQVLGIDDDFTSSIGFSFIDAYADAYPDLTDSRENVLSALSGEEAKFRATLESGIREFHKLEGDTISGAEAFLLFASYGFPIEMLEELALEKGKTVDLDGFRDEMKKHRDLSRTASEGKFKGGLADQSEKTTAYHTATHLLLAGLRAELGDHVNQAGSNITEKRLRFDFTHPEKVERETLDRVEAFVNAVIETGAGVGSVTMDREAARESGVTGSFWDKYPKTVSVYTIEGPDGTIYSRELCGGPHVDDLSALSAFGRFQIKKEESSSAGVRRIKAVLE